MSPGTARSPAAPVRPGGAVRDRAGPTARLVGGGDEVGDGGNTHQRRKPRPERRGALSSVATAAALAGRGDSRKRLATSSGVVSLGLGPLNTPILSPPSTRSRPSRELRRSGCARDRGTSPPRGPRSRAVASLRVHGPAARGPKARGLMSLSATAGPRVPRRVAGGFVLLPARTLLNAWHRCRTRPLGVGDFRTWLACREMVARRCALGEGQAPDLRLRRAGPPHRRLGTAGPRLRPPPRRRRAARPGATPTSASPPASPAPGPCRAARPSPTPSAPAAATWPSPAASSASWPEAPDPPWSPPPWASSSAACRGAGGGSRPGDDSRPPGSPAPSPSTSRRVKQARLELVALGWLTTEPTDPWAERRWGRAYRVDLDWAPPPPAAAAGAPFATPTGRRRRAFATP